MEIKEIVVARTYKVNLGNYENVDVHVSMRAELDELDSVIISMRHLASYVEDAALGQLVSAYRARGKKVTDKEIGRRHGIRVL